MKLANALSERSDIQRRLSELNTRLHNNAKVQEGETPSEDPVVLLKELDELTNRLEELIYHINKTNNETYYERKSVNELLAHRDCLKQKISILRSFLDEASSRVDRYSRSEIKIISSCDVPALQKQVDALSKELREVDESIQAVNWLTELI